MFWTLPNALSILRIAAAPLLVALAGLGEAEAFLGVLWCALASDAADGFLARRLGQTSEIGARLDSWGDWLLYAALPLGVVWLWPELARRELLWIATGVTVWIVPTAVGWLKFGRLTSYHTYLAKLTGVLMAAGAVALLHWDHPALFHLAICVLVLEGFEELLITAELPAWHRDVPSLRSAMRIAEDTRAQC